MANVKKFIAPGCWFSMLYPAQWSEFESGEEAFLFYNPNRWTGNFRISAFRGADTAYGRQAVRRELDGNKRAVRQVLGTVETAYSRETFTEDGRDYENHRWVAGIDDVAFEVNFAAGEGMPAEEAAGVVASLQIRHAGAKYPAELIPVRLSEIWQIDEAYQWVESEVKKRLTKDFRGERRDVAAMQRIVDGGDIPAGKREPWLSLGITLCAVVANEVDGYEWQTLIDGNREAPVLVRLHDGRVTDPMRLVWSRVRAGETVDLDAAYEEIIYGHDTHFAG